MTDGILLNEMMSDFLLSKYSVIVIDEAHERKVSTDLLISLLTKVVNIRLKKAVEQYENAEDFSQIKIHPLRLVIMSATLRTFDFMDNKKMFPEKPPLVHIPVRSFPVDVYFNKQTPENYIQDALKKCLKIHQRLP
jgi:ATP-dependent RNA helicase DHX37/DHR1